MKMFSKKEKKKLKTTHYKLQTSSGFTLMEILLAMAIIAIMSGAILMSLGQQRKKANQSKFSVELASVIQPMLMCRSDGHTVNSPAGGTGGAGENICVGEPNYGKWPDISGTDFAGVYTSAINADGTWFFHIDDGTVRICCNSTSSKCHSLDTLDPCTVAVPAL